MAGDLSAIRDRHEVRHADVAESRLRERTPRVERAAPWDVEQARDLGAPQWHALLGARDGRVRLGDRTDERGGVWVRRVRHERLSGCELDDAAEVHHPDAPMLREVAGDREVVRDQHDRHTEIVAECQQQIEERDADGHVDHRDRLVRDDHPRVDRERAGDRDSLTLAAGELMRVLREEVIGRREPDASEQLEDLPRRVISAARLAVTEQRRRERVVHGPDGIERCVRILVHQLHRSAERREILPALLPHIVPFEQQSATGRSEEAREQPARGRLAAAALADQAHRLSRRECERDLIHGADASLWRRERPAHPIELDEVPARGGDVPDRLDGSHQSASAGRRAPTASATACQRMHAAV